jgi:hypothetical protein
MEKYNSPDTVWCRMLTGDYNFYWDTCFCKTLPRNNWIANSFFFLLFLSFPSPLLPYFCFLLLLLVLLIFLCKIHNISNGSLNIQQLGRNTVYFFPNLAISVALSRKANCVHFVVSSFGYCCDSFKAPASGFEDTSFSSNWMSFYPSVPPHVNQLFLPNHIFFQRRFFSQF